MLIRLKEAWNYNKSTRIDRWVVTKGPVHHGGGDSARAQKHR